jgi:hypothetical protein
MATLDASPILYELTTELEALRSDPHIQAVCAEWVDETYTVWVGIEDDNQVARRVAYFVEDQMSEKFPGTAFDFHVIALPKGKKTQDYASNAQVVFQRAA